MYGFMSTGTYLSTVLSTLCTVKDTVKDYVAVDTLIDTDKLLVLLTFWPVMVHVLGTYVFFSCLLN